MKHVYIIGTCDTKHTEILYVRNLLFSQGISTCIVDVGIYERMLPPAGMLFTFVKNNSTFLPTLPTVARHWP